MATVIVKRMHMKDLVKGNALIEEARDLWAMGRDYMARCGNKYLEARAAFGWVKGPLPLPYLAALIKADVGESTERRAIQFAKDPSKAVAHRGEDLARNNAKNAAKRARNSERNAPQQTKYLPVAPPSRPGEIHEAKIGFRALMNKAEKSEDMDKSRAYRLVAFQHFKFLLNQSTLPALMEMSADEIIELVRKI